MHGPSIVRAGVLDRDPNRFESPVPFARALEHVAG